MVNLVKNIVVLGTGGTISGKGAAGKTHGYKPGQMSIDDMIRDITGITELANIHGIQVLNTASDNIRGKDLIGLANKINELSENPNLDGFVLTHGTDTLEETAF